MSCEGKKKSTVIIHNNGQDLPLKFDTAPIYVTCKNNTKTACRKLSVSWQLKTEYQGVAGVYTGTNFAYGPLLGIKNDANNIYFYCLGVRSDFSCNLQGNPSWVFVSGGSVGSFIPGTATITGIQDITGTTDPDTQHKGIVITDRYGNVLFSDESLPCSWDIICDDDCPPGTCKCATTNYPGYCCLDCASTAAQIRSVTESLKAQNNGR